MSILSGNDVLWDGDAVCASLDRFNGFYCWCRPDAQAQPFELFYLLWKNYIANRLDDIKRLYDAMHAQYNPLDNYDMEDSEHKGTAVDETTITTTPDGKQVTEISKTGLNSASYVGTDKSELSYDEYSNTSVTTMSNTLVNDPLDGVYHAVDDRVMTRKGNIGVMSSQDLILKEWELRSKTLLNYIVEQFVAVWSYSVRGVS